MELSAEQKGQIYEQGYVFLPGLIPDELVNQALWAINNSLGWKGMPPEEILNYSSRSFCPELTQSPAILDLALKSPLLSLCESAVGTGRADPPQLAQIALRFPLPRPAVRPDMPRPASANSFLGPHVDGIYAPRNGVPEGQILSFTTLLGVFLSDVNADFMGNFTVWPGTHRQYEAYFREHGPESLLDGMPPVDLPEPVQLKAKAGDAILCHYQLGHTVVPNFSPHIRYAVFFRVWAVGHQELGLQVLSDIWQEWEGMRDTVGQPVS